MTAIRLIPEWPFPDYIFVPGENPHPKKNGGHMEGEGDPLAEPLIASRPQENKFFRYALDLYNHGYFWESHVYFEALWNAHKRQGSVADFLKGMIKLGAAGVKFKIGQKPAAIGHMERALELFATVQSTEGDIFLGINLKQLIEQIKKNIISGELNFPVIPEWK